MNGLCVSVAGIFFLMEKLNSYARPWHPCLTVGSRRVWTEAIETFQEARLSQMSHRKPLTNGLGLSPFTQMRSL